MDKVIEIDGKKVGFRATALTPRIYRHLIGRDIVQDLSALQAAYIRAVKAAGLEKPGKDAPPAEQEAYDQAVRSAQLQATDLEVFEDVAYIMARQYDPGLPGTAEEWLDGFATFSIYEVLPAILSLWADNSRQTARPKKK